MNIKSIAFAISYLDDYEKAFKKTYDDFKQNPNFQTKLIFAFICSATVEYCVNKTVSSYKRYAPDSYVPDWGAGLRKRFEYFILVISNGQFTIDKTHPVFTTIDSLIVVRNKLAHISDVHKTSPGYIGSESGSTLFDVKMEESEAIVKLTPEFIDTAFEATSALVAKFMRTYQAVQGDFIVANPGLNLKEIF